MKLLFLSMLVLALIGCVSTPITHKDSEGDIQVRVETSVPPQIADEQYRERFQQEGGESSKLGYVFEGMTKEQLENVGYTEFTLLEYTKSGNEEWMMFSDWVTPEDGDTVTFYLKDGKVVRWIRDKDVKKDTVVGE